MTLERVGFFRELPHGDPEGASIRSSQGQLPGEVVSAAAAYLRDGAVLATTGQSAADWFDPKRVAGPLDMLTDGRWIWPGDLAFYVERHRVALPEEFLEWMRDNDWHCPKLNHSCLLEAEAELFSK